MREKDKFFAIVPIHERIVLLEGETIDRISEKVNQALKKPEEVYPFHNFKAEITFIKGRKVKISQPK